MNLKDEWVTANQVRETCGQTSGSYTRKVLEVYSASGIIERRPDPHPHPEYRADPVDGKVKCPVEPEKTDGESVCARVEPHVKGIEKALASPSTESSGDWLGALVVMAVVTAPIWITSIFALGVWSQVGGGPKGAPAITSSTVD